MGDSVQGWRTYKVSETAGRGGLVGGPFGSSLGTKDYVESGVPVIRGQNLSGPGRFNASDFVFVSEAKADELSRNLAVAGDLVLTQRGTLGQVGVVPAGGHRRYVISQSQMRLRPNPEVAMSEFLYYVFRSKEMLAAIDARAIVTGVPHINLGILGELPIGLPPLAEQRAIAGVLGALDDKIESNRRLWSLALELLDGARLAVAESGVTARRSLGDLVEFNRSTLKPGSGQEELLYIDIASVSPGEISNRQRLTWDDAPSRARRGVTDGDIIFSTVRPGRRSFSVILDPKPGTVASTGFAVMTPRSIGTAYLLGTVADPAFAEYCETVSQGSAYPAVSPEAMSRYEVLVPGNADLGRLESEMMPVLRRGHRALSENEALTELRDALLPELLSGRLRVREVEEMVGSV